MSFLSQHRISARVRAIAGSVLICLLATACGGEASSPTEARLDPVTTTSVAAVEDTAVDTVVVEPDESVPAASSTGEMPEALAFAIESAQTDSYMFEQGMLIELASAGASRGTAEPYAFGSVSEEMSYVRVDLEAFAVESMSGLAAFGVAGPDLTGQEFEVWTNEATLTMDLSNVSILNTEIEAASAGPVSVDLNEVDGLDASSVASQFGQGSAFTDPAGLFEALGTLAEAEDLGTTMLGDIEVTHFVSTVPVTEYFDAQGVDLSNQLGVVDSLGFEGAEAAAIGGLVDQMDDLEVKVNMFVDTDGRVRRVATDLELTELVVQMFSAQMAAEDGAAATPDLSAIFGPNGLQIILSGWHEFHSFGDVSPIEAPEATDVTASAGELFG